MKPVHVAWDELADLLLDMSQRVRVGDSLEGHISWELDYGGPDDAECGDDRPLVEAAYRYGNRDHGQGFMRIIGEP